MPRALKCAFYICLGLLAAAVLAVAVDVALSPDHRGLRAALTGQDAAARSAAIGHAPRVERLRASAVFGSKKAAFKLGRLLASGDLGYVDYERAARWMKDAADKGYGPAQLYMARFCFLGQGMAKDEKAGAQWVRQATQSHVPHAGGLMGMLYLGGIGVEQNFDQAVAWLKKADTPEALTLAANIQKNIDAMSALPAPEKTAAMNAFALRYKTDIGKSFAKTLADLNAKADEDATQSASDTVSPNNGAQKNGH